MTGPDQWVTVQLTEWERKVCSLVASWRNSEAQRMGFRNRHGTREEDAENVHLIGSLAECAFAKATSQYWPMGVNAFKDPDVGLWEVRGRSKHYYKLILRDQDVSGKIASPFVHVVEKNDHFIIKGWYPCWDVQKHPEWRESYDNRETAWFIPDHELKPFTQGDLNLWGGTPPKETFL